MDGIVAVIALAFSIVGTSYVFSDWTEKMYFDAFDFIILTLSVACFVGFLLIVAL